MNKFKRNPLSECELLTMKCVWDAQGEPITCHEIMQKMREEYGLDYRDTTVYTFLSKLKEKGFVKSYRKKTTYYIPLRSEEEYRSEQMRKQKNFWFGGSTAQMVQALCKDEEEISDAERELIKNMFAEEDD